MQNYMRERQVAMGLARQRELFYNWYSPFYGLVVLGCTIGYVCCTVRPGLCLVGLYAGFFLGVVLIFLIFILCYRAIKGKNPKVFLPVVPFGFLWGYQYDMAMGNKMERIRGMRHQCALY